MPTFIYALKDPETRKIRYIGVADRPKRRLSVHLADKQHNRRTAWIKSLKSRGLLPDMEILLEIPKSERAKWEIKFIATARGMGLDLVNGTAGGDGCFNPTPELRARFSEMRRGDKHPLWGKHHSAETRAKMRAAKLGEKHPRFGKKDSLEMRLQKSAGWTAEVRARMSLSKKGKPWSAARRAAYEAKK